MTDIQHQILAKSMCDDEWMRRLWYGHLRGLNPEAERDIDREQWHRVGWEALASLAFLVFMSVLVRYA